MKIIGLTGPSGSGKGAVAQIFEEHSIPCIDTDAVYHQILAEGGACTEELAFTFGDTILNENRLVDRKKLAACVFGHPDTEQRLAKLNHITHKYVMEKTWQLVKEWEKKGPFAILIDAPQLFEAGIEQDCDLTIGVIAEQDTRKLRIMARDGISEKDALLRINAQKSADFYKKHCDFILQNDADMDTLRSQIDAVLKALQKGE